jgi:hypothetical protein
MAQKMLHHLIDLSLECKDLLLGVIAGFRHRASLLRLLLALPCPRARVECRKGFATLLAISLTVVHPNALHNRHGCDVQSVVGKQTGTSSAFFSADSLDGSVCAGSHVTCRQQVVDALPSIRPFLRMADPTHRPRN